MPSGTFLLEKERNRYYLVLVSRNWFSCGFVDRTRQVIAEGEGLLDNKNFKPPAGSFALTSVTLGIRCQLA